MIGLLLPTGVLAKDEPIFDKTQQSAASRGAEEYAMVYFIETYRWNYVTITYPDGSTDYESKKFKLSESPRHGKYSWLMPYLNKLSADGYSIKSHSMSVSFGEDPNDWVHVYILARPTPLAKPWKTAPVPGR